MPAGRAKDIEMVRGDTPTWFLGFSRGSGPLALPAGTLIWFTAKRALTDEDAGAVFRKSVGSGVTITDATNGKAKVTLAATDTNPLPDADTLLYYDVQIKETSGVITSFLGKLMVRCDVTVEIT